MRTPRELAAVAVGIVLIFAVAGLSRVPWTVHPDEDARLRLSWRIRGESLECRTLTPEELEELPVHMRNAEACEPRGRSFRLRVWVDGDAVVDRVVDPGGARGDRPVYVFVERSLAPGRRDLRVAFEPLEDPGGTGGTDATDPADPAVGLHHEGTVEVAPREVVLITLGSDASGEERLELRGPTSLPRSPR